MCQRTSTHYIQMGLCESFVQRTSTFKWEIVNHLFKEQVHITFRWEFVNHLFKEQVHITFR